MADVHITPEGLEAVQKELDELISHKRPSIVAKIKAARELGDLSENFEYHAAKNEQGMMEARINELEAIIKNHVIIEARTEKASWGWAAQCASRRTAPTRRSTGSSAPRRRTPRQVGSAMSRRWARR